MRSYWAAHELLEMNDFLRKLIADIELHALCYEMTTNPELQSILMRHIQVMHTEYNQAINLLQNKELAMAAVPAYRSPFNYNPQIGLQNQQIVPSPTYNGRRLSDFIITTLGSVLGTVSVNESTDPDIRAFLTMCVNNCQQMAYEVWQHMNARGYYEPPEMPAGAVREMMQVFQPAVHGYATASL
ncbi:spore coat protein [Paenibacillus xerothermodurans]|uniref:Spore coat protein n=1 Tax=Paenibacillus xerothermodurans TaxID=1977292 RepID=A0A2W1N9E7_PAEXE|nr:spore coat protein [Paenibacillus xerothermodurans]PZE20554.1 spore coat protein [Paenibacillus xerothermodurans]